MPKQLWESSELQQRSRTLWSSENKPGHIKVWEAFYLHRPTPSSVQRDFLRWILPHGKRKSRRASGSLITAMVICSLCYWGPQSSHQHWTQLIELHGTSPAVSPHGVWGLLLLWDLPPGDPLDAMPTLWVWTPQHLTIYGTGAAGVICALPLGF